MLRPIKKLIKTKLWRRRNSHNFTTLAGDNFPLDKVTVGKLTYGPLRAISYGGSDEFLKIGNCCSIADGVTFLLGGVIGLSAFQHTPFAENLSAMLRLCQRAPSLLKTMFGLDMGQRFSRASRWVKDALSVPVRLFARTSLPMRLSPEFPQKSLDTDSMKQ